jgi:hypothetical protein
VIDFDGDDEVNISVSVTCFVFILGLQKWDGP